MVWASPLATTSELMIRWSTPWGLESALRQKAVLSLGLLGGGGSEPRDSVWIKLNTGVPAVATRVSNWDPPREAMK